MPEADPVELVFNGAVLCILSKPPAGLFPAFPFHPRAESNRGLHLPKHVNPVKLYPNNNIMEPVFKIIYKKYTRARCKIYFIYMFAQIF